MPGLHEDVFDAPEVEEVYCDCGCCEDCASQLWDEFEADLRLEQQEMEDFERTDEYYGHFDDDCPW